MIQFANLNFLWMLWLIPVVIAFQIWAARRKNFLIEQFVSPELKSKLLAHFSLRRQRGKELLFILALVFTIIALIRPRYGFHWEEVTRKGVDIMIALDVSKSMLAEDVSPNRMERAKREIIDLINIVQGDRLGLIAFAGTSFLQCPLTLDYGAVEIFLDELDTDLIPVPGTAIAEAIDKASLSFDQANPNAKALILITDGEDHLADPVAAAKKASEKNIRIYAIGIGKEGGAPIPDPNGGFKKNSRGEVILSKLDEESLQKIALASGGSYVRSTSGNLDFEKIYKDIKSNIEDRELASGRKKRYEERYQWPLSLALLLLVLEMIVRENVRARTKGRSRLTRWLAPKSLMLFLAACGTLSWQPKAMALFDTSKAQEGEEAYEKGNFQEALKNLLDAQIEDPANLKLKYNLGNVYYRLEDYSNAEKMYAEVAKSSDPELAKKAQYNLGNTAFKQGKLKEALDHYKEVLALDPKDQDASHNIEVVQREIKKRLEEQKKRQEQQENQQQQNQEGQDKKDGQQDQKKDGQDKQNQDQKDSQQDQKKDGQDKQNQDQKDQGEGKDKQNQDQKDGQQDQTKDAQGQDEKNEKEQGQKQDDNDKDKTGGAAQQGEETKEMSKEEAERWLSTLKNDRKEYLQKKLQGEGSGKYRMEKDW